jgi:hypothetical protein
MRLALFFFLMAHTVMTVALLRSSPAQIDVQVYLHDGVIRLLHGQNPYTMTIPNIYQSPFTEMFYGPDLVVQGRVPVGFPYLPVALLLSIPGYVLGDVRYSQLIAMLVTVLVLRRLASDRVGCSRPRGCSPNRHPNADRGMGGTGSSGAPCLLDSRAQKS